MEEELIELVQSIKGVAPEVWAAAQQVVQAKIYQHSLGVTLASLIMLMCGTAAFWFMRRRVWDDEWFFVGTVSGVGLIVSLLALVVNITSLIYLWTAPDYAAMQALKALIPVP